MGMTIWIHTLEERNYSKDSDDHSHMCRHLEAIDEVCQNIGVRALGEFMDYTDQEYNFNELEDEDEEESEQELHAETGLAYGIDDMTWFEADKGLPSFKALRDAISSSGISGLTPVEVEELIDELDNCISILEKSATQNGKFHLTLVE